MEAKYDGPYSSAITYNNIVLTSARLLHIAAVFRKWGDLPLQKGVVHLLSRMSDFETYGSMETAAVTKSSFPTREVPVLFARVPQSKLTRTTPLNSRFLKQIALKYSSSFHLLWGTRWCSWLSHGATSWKVAGSISDSIIGIFY
jgi:hypothetical protein